MNPTESILTTAVIDGPVTVVAVTVKGKIGIGLARCLEDDKFSDDVGIGIASARALQDIGQQFEDLWVSRAVTKTEYRRKRQTKRTK